MEYVYEYDGQISNKLRESQQSAVVRFRAQLTVQSIDENTLAIKVRVTCFGARDFFFLVIGDFSCPKSGSSGAVAHPAMGFGFRSRRAARRSPSAMLSICSARSCSSTTKDRSVLYVSLFIGRPVLFL